MSGGHFNYYQDRISYIADQIDELIWSNSDTSLDQWGNPRGRGYTAETIAKFEEASHTLRRAAEMARRIDWLVSADDAEDTFHKRWAEKVRPVSSK